MRIYIMASCTISESVDIAGVFDSLDEALEFMKERSGYHLIGINIGFPMTMKYLSDYSTIYPKAIEKERKNMNLESWEQDYD